MQRMRRSVSGAVATLLCSVGLIFAGGASAEAAQPADMDLLDASGSPDPVLTNQSVTFLVSFVDRGPGRATGVELGTQLPAGVRFEPDQSDSACSETGGVVSCRFPSADVNGVFLVRVTVTPATAGTLQLTFTVTAAERDPDLSNNSTTAAVQVVEPVEADVSIRLPDSQLFAGQPTFYFFEVGNAGPATATDITAALDFPSGLVPTDTTGCAPIAAGLTCTYLLGELPPQRGIAVPILLNPAPAGSYAVSGQVSAAQPDPLASNNSDTAVIEVRAVADVSVQVAESADPVTPGQPLTYAVTISNAGPSPASAVTVVDAWTSTTRRLDLFSVTSSQGQCSLTAAATLECQLGMLASGASVTVQVTLRPRGSGTVTDEARVSAAESDPDTANNVDSETTTAGTG